jgi:hypothetical protein
VYALIVKTIVLLEAAAEKDSVLLLDLADMVVSGTCLIEVDVGVMYLKTLKIKCKKFLKERL